jgi:hypothetical protein
MDSHFENQTTILDIPDDIIHNQISKYLLEDKTINKMFYDKNDYYLLNFLCGKIWDVKYVEPKFVWNEYKININLDCIKTYLNTRHNLNCDSLKIFYRVNNSLNFVSYIINIFHNDNKFGFINMMYRIIINGDKDDNMHLRHKECQNTMDKITNEIKEYIKSYKKN